MELSILNLNVWHGLFARTFWRAELLQDPATRERRFAAIVAGIRSLAPDVVTLQECFPQPAFGRRIGRALGYEDVCGVSNAGLRLFGYGFPFGVKTGEGLTILARPGLGLRSLGGKNLSGFGLTHGHLSLQPVQKRCGLAAEITVEGKAVVVVTAHVRYEFATTADLDRAWHELRDAGKVQGEVPNRLRAAVASEIATREGELATLEDWCARLETRAPFVLAADMNLDDEAPALVSFVERLRLTSVLVAAGDGRRTWDPGNPNVAASAAYEHVDGVPKTPGELVVAQHDRWPQRPDHVFLGPTLAGGDIVEARVVLDRPVDGIVPSDHYGILARIRL